MVVSVCAETSDAFIEDGAQGEADIVVSGTSGIGLIEEVQRGNVDEPLPRVGGIYTFSRCLEMSKWSTHRCVGRMSKARTRAMLDGGACVNCISVRFAELAKIPIRRRTNSITFKTVDG